MSSQLTRIVLLLLAVVLAAWIVWDIERPPFSVAVTPRTAELRNGLTEIERSTIEVFERTSPSVVQISGRAAGSNKTDDETIQSGSGFVWDAAGDIVTNDHVVTNTESLTVRFASGEVAKAQIVGIASNYDLAVIRVGQLKASPPPISIGTSADLRVGQFAYAIGKPIRL